MTATPHTPQSLREALAQGNDPVAGSRILAERIAEDEFEDEPVYNHATAINREFSHV